MRESDPTGYHAVMQDLRDETPEHDPARAHAEELLGWLTADNQERDKELFGALNEAWRHQARTEAGEQ
jgi:hypothetical protein